MPYKLSGNSVVKSDSGEVVKTHPTRAKALAHLRALKANVEEGSPAVLGALLEGVQERVQEAIGEDEPDALLLREEFKPSAHPRDWHGRFKIGDMVRLKVKAPDGMDVVGRIQRFTDDGKKAIVAPVRGGAHVEATPGDIAFHSPKSHVSAAERYDAAEKRALELSSSGVSIPSGVNDPNLARRRAARERQAAGSERTAPTQGAKRVRMPKVREGIGMLLEGFAPAETPAQSQARGAAQVKQAQASLSSGWNAGKHPRAQGGRFGYTTGGKRATRSSSSRARTLGVGASGALVRSVQQQLGVPADGKYGPQTRSAVARYQQQHHLQVDGVVGRQTLAALRGHTNPQSVAPGPISSRAATVRPHPLHRAKRARKPPAPARYGGGVVV